MVFCTKKRHDCLNFRHFPDLQETSKRPLHCRMSPLPGDRSPFFLPLLVRDLHPVPDRYLDIREQDMGVRKLRRTFSCISAKTQQFKRCLEESSSRTSGVMAGSGCSQRIGPVIVFPAQSYTDGTHTLLYSFVPG
jgi:hypothetical protein